MDTSRNDAETTTTKDQSNSVTENDSKRSAPTSFDGQDQDKESFEKVQTNLFGYSDGSSDEEHQINSATNNSSLEKNQVSPSSFYNDLEELDWIYFNVSSHLKSTFQSYVSFHFRNQISANSFDAVSIQKTIYSNCISNFKYSYFNFKVIMNN